MALYGDLRFRDRLLRGAIGAVVGAGLGCLFALQEVMRGGHANPVVFIPATLVGGAIGGWLAFRRRRIGW
jgi:hypothetical protein